jgi:hypothetical protein
MHQYGQHSTMQASDEMSSFSTQGHPLTANHRLRQNFNQAGGGWAIVRQVGEVFRMIPYCNNLVKGLPLSLILKKVLPGRKL